MESADVTATSLSKFVSECSSDGSEEVLNTYCRNSPHCSDIFAAFEKDGQQQPTPRELQLAFQALECVLLYTASLSKDVSSSLAGVGALRAVGQTVVTKLLQYHMKMVYHSLNTASPSYLVRSCLKLLIAVCAQGAESTRQLANVLDLGFKPLQQLPARKDAKSTDDIRSAFVKFCVALLLYGDADVIKIAMESNVLLGSLFKLLPLDRPLVVHLLLSALQDKVLKNPVVSKRSKVDFFSSNVLLLISKLCHRFGDSIAEASGGGDDDSDSEVRSVTVASLAAGFLHTVCCSTTHGIGFASKYSASGESNNPILLRFLVSIPTTDRNVLLDDLIISALSAYPDLLHSYWVGASFSLEPRPSHSWLNNIKLAISVLESVECPPFSLLSAPNTVADDISTATSIFVDACARKSSVAPAAGDDGSSSSMAPALLMGALTPSSMTSAMLGHGMQHSNSYVKLYTLRLQALVLQRTDHFLTWCHSVSRRQSTSSNHPVASNLSASEANRLASQVQGAVTQLMPNINVLTAACQQLLNDYGTTVGSASLQLDNAEGRELPDISGGDLLSAVLECLISYQSLVPSCFIQTGYDLCKLLAPSSPGTEAAGAGNKSFLSLPRRIQTQVLRLLLQSTSNSLQWHKPMAKAGYSPLHVIMRSYLTALTSASEECEDSEECEECVATAERLLKKLCQETEVVVESEVSNWLQAVHHLDDAVSLSPHIDAFSDLTENVFCGLVTNPHAAASLWAEFSSTISPTSGVLSEEPVFSVAEILRAPVRTERLTVAAMSDVDLRQTSSPLFLAALDRLPALQATHQLSVFVTFLLKYIPLCMSQFDEPKLVSKYIKHFFQARNFDDAGVVKKLLRASRDGAVLLSSASTVETHDEKEEGMDVEENGTNVGATKLDGTEVQLNFRLGKDNWNAFAVQTLKSHFGSPSALLYISELIPQIYTSPSVSKAQSQLPLERLHQMVMSHSMFLETLLTSSSAPAQSADGDITMNEIRNSDELKMKQKDAVVTLLLAIVEAGSAACSQAHVTILLAAYSPYLTSTDSKLFAMLRLYESKSFSLASVRMSLWGESAIAYLRDQSLQADASQGALKSLWNDGCLDRVLQHLDRATLMQSVLSLPLDLPLDVVTGTDFPSRPERVTYDPRFLLPLFAESLKPGLVVDCHRFVDSGALSFCLGCLASLEDSTRAAAYLVLQLFCDHMESDNTFRERYHISMLLRNIVNAVVEPCQRLPFVIALFLSKAAIQLLHPEHWLYPMLNRFFLQRPVLEVADLPLFYNLFNSTSMQYKRERNWMLELLTEGLRHVTDLYLYQRRHVLELVMTFYLSSTCLNRCKDRVCKLVKQGWRLEACRRYLFSQLGLLPWLSHALTLAVQGCTDQQHLDILASFITQVLSEIGQSTAEHEHRQPPAVSDPATADHFTADQCYQLLRSLQSCQI